MPKLNIEHVKSGMIISEDVKGPNGQTLLGKGALLSEKHLRIFKTWGVQYISIEGDEHHDQDETSTALPPELLQQAKEELLPRFKHTNYNHPLINILLEEATRLRAIQLQNLD